MQRAKAEKLLRTLMPIPLLHRILQGLANSPLHAWRGIALCNKLMRPESIRYRLHILFIKVLNMYYMKALVIVMQSIWLAPTYCKCLCSMVRGTSPSEAALAEDEQRTRGRLADYSRTNCIGIPRPFCGDCWSLTRYRHAPRRRHARRRFAPRYRHAIHPYISSTRYRHAPHAGPSSASCFIVTRYTQTFLLQ